MASYQTKETTVPVNISKKTKTQAGKRRRQWFKSKLFKQNAKHHEEGELEHQLDDVECNDLDRGQFSLEFSEPREYVIAGNPKQMRKGGPMFAGHQSRVSIRRGDGVHPVDETDMNMAGEIDGDFGLQEIENELQLTALTRGESKNSKDEIDVAENVHFFDFNMHSIKKSVSSCLLDVALLMANISQMKTVYTLGDTHPFYTALMALLGTSLVLQICIGFALIWLSSRININNSSEKVHQRASKLATFIVVAIFMLTIINILIGGIGITGVNQSHPPTTNVEPVTTNTET